MFVISVVADLLLCCYFVVYCCLCLFASLRLLDLFWFWYYWCLVKIRFVVCYLCVGWLVCLLFTVDCCCLSLDCGFVFCVDLFGLSWVLCYCLMVLLLFLCLLGMAGGFSCYSYDCLVDLVFVVNVWLFV